MTTYNSEFLLCFSGFLIPSESFAAPLGMRTPTLLVQGENDTLVLPEWMSYLCDLFDKDAGNVRVKMHEGGTKVVLYLHSDQ